MLAAELKDTMRTEQFKEEKHANVTIPKGNAGGC
jgi:hypothetical protein